MLLFLAPREHGDGLDGLSEVSGLEGVLGEEERAGAGAREAKPRLPGKRP